MKGKLVSKEVSKDVCKCDSAYLKSLTRCQINTKTKTISLQTGLQIRGSAITFSHIIGCVV